MKVKVFIQKSSESRSDAASIKIPIKERETVDTLLIKLSRRYPDFIESILDPRTGDIKEEFNINLNGRSIKKIKGLHTRLKNKDEVSILPEDSSE